MKTRHLDQYQLLLVEKAADSFIALVCLTWKVTGEKREALLLALRTDLMEHFAEALDDCWDNPESFSMEKIQ